MDRKQAASILKRQDGNMHEWAAAGAYLHSFYSHEGRAELQPFTVADAVTYDRRPSDHDDVGYPEPETSGRRRRVQDAATARAKAIDALETSLRRANARL